MGLNDDFWGVLGVPTSMVGLVMEMMLFAMPIWTAFLVGLFIGWAWRPSWWPKHKLDSFVYKFGVTSNGHSVDDVGVSNNKSSINVHHTHLGLASCSSSRVKDKDHPLVNDDDLAHLCRLVEVKDGGPSWIQMMDRSTPTMSYKAWRRDPEVGPPQYRSSTIFEDATPEMVRDFFWDDEFRSKWDNMLIHSHTIEECHSTGTMIVQWVRKFPFFCSDREYIIGRRIWDSERTFYCVTKGVPNSSIPRRDKPRRVDLYYSSWCIRAVESKRGNGQMTACEVLLFHHEDMGIPWEIAKLGVRQGMWGAVKKIDPGLRSYQKARATNQPLSNSAIIAQTPTKVGPQRLISLMNAEKQVGSVSEEEEEAVVEEKREGMNAIPKFLVLGGVAVLACSLDRGLLTKAVIFGVARKLGRMGGKI